VLITVDPWERVLRYRRGQLVEVLPSGTVRRFRSRSRLIRIDLRPQLLLVPGQEVLTADGLSVRVSVLGTFAVDDAQLWHETVAEPREFLYAAIQIAVREAVATRTLEQLLAERSDLGLLDAVAPAAAPFGATVSELSVKDLMVPGELRRAAMELAVARQAGAAALERARSEVAAVRALTNAAKMVGDNPALLQLRTLQAVEHGRATVVLSQAPVAGG
jgi:regulator of protease activity HflC (stomatin/prohibitin superfamily)